MRLVNPININPPTGGMVTSREGVRRVDSEKSIPDTCNGAEAEYFPRDKSAVKDDHSRYFDFEYTCTGEFKTEQRPITGCKKGRNKQPDSYTCN